MKGHVLDQDAVELIPAIEGFAEVDDSEKVLPLGEHGCEVVWGDEATVRTKGGH